MSEKSANLEESIFIQQLTKDLKLGFGKFIICTGPPGTGKSYASLRLGEIIDNEFNIEKVVIGDGLEFVSLLKRVMAGEFRNGTFLLFDEAGMGMSAREWNKKQNKLMSVVLQLIRKMGLCICFTVPTLDMIDVTARRVANFWMHAVAVDLRQKKASFKLWALEYDNYTRKLYRYNLKHMGRDVILWRFKLPEKINLKQYEEKKDRALNKLLNEAEKVLSESPKKDARGRPSKFDKDEIKELLGTGLKPGEIAEEVGCSTTYVQTIKRELRSH